MENYGRDDATLKLLVFHGIGRDDIEQHQFTCEVIWEANKIVDDQAKISQLETTFRERDLTWYMEFKTMTLVGKVRSLDKIKQ